MVRNLNHSLSDARCWSNHTTAGPRTRLSRWHKCTYVHARTHRHAPCSWPSRPRRPQPTNPRRLALLSSTWNECERRVDSQRTSVYRAHSVSFRCLCCVCVSACMGSPVGLYLSFWQRRGFGLFPLCVARVCVCVCVRLQSFRPTRCCYFGLFECWGDPGLCFVFSDGECV